MPLPRQKSQPEGGAANSIPLSNESERRLRPCVIQRKVTNGYRAKWAADNEAAVRTVVDTARLNGVGPFQTILNVVAI
jgi:transposase